MQPLFAVKQIFLVHELHPSLVTLARVALLLPLLPDQTAHTITVRALLTAPKVEVTKSLCARSNPGDRATARVALDVPNVADSPRTSQVVLALLLSRDLHLLHCIGLSDTEDVATEALTLVVPASSLHKPLLPLRPCFPKTVDALTRTNLLGAAGNTVL